MRRLLYPLLLCLLSHCTSHPFCKVKEGNHGMIINTIFIPCFSGDAKNGLILRTPEELKRVIDTTACNVPTIDFANESVLALYADGGCDVGFERTVTANTTMKNYHYTVKVTQCGNCKSMALSYNLVRVPALPLDWTVSFEVVNAN